MKQQKLQFKFTSPKSVACDFIFGSQGKLAMVNNFGFLGENKFFLNEREKHPHPMGAFLRSYYHTMVMNSLEPTGFVLDIGASMNRHTFSKTPTGTPWHERSHLAVPIINAEDRYRDYNYRRTISSAGLTYPKSFCRHIMGIDEGHVCPCSLGKFDVVTSIDSIYYPGVLEAILHRLKYEAPRSSSFDHKPEKPDMVPSAYIAFCDFNHLIRIGRRNALFCDKEADVQFTTNQRGDYVATVHVEGNPIPYVDRVLRTHEKSWQYCFKNKYYIADVIQSFDNGEVPYKLLKLTPVGNLPCEWLNIINVDYGEHFLSKPAEPRIEIVTQHQIPEESFIDTMRIAMKTNLEDISCEDGVITARIHQKNWWTCGCKRRSSTLKAPLKDVLDEVPKCAGRYSPSEILRSARVFVQKQVSQGIVDKRKLDEMRSVMILANFYSAYLVGSVINEVIHSETVSKFKDVMNGLKTEFMNKIPWMKLLKTFVQVLTLVAICSSTLSIANKQMVRANPGMVEDDSENNDTFAFVMTVIAVTILKTWLDSLKKPKPKHDVRSLQGSCVVDESRLDLEKNKGVFPADWKFRDQDWIKPLCDAKDKPAAYQVAPIIKYEDYTEPTIKHVCKKTVMAAAIRATSNKVLPRPQCIKDFAGWFRNNIIKEFRKALDLEDITVDVETWLLKYPQSYRDNINHVIKKDEWREKTHFPYESFPKIEQQFTEVTVEQKETILNTTKERQISSPSTEKKIMANAFINILEGVADRHLKEYCGKKNWEQICQSLDDDFQRIPDGIIGEADQSGFDMTQLAPQHQLMDELVNMAAHHPNVHFKEPLTPELVMTARRDSHVLDVNVGRGAVNYKAQGRASGDGWTTFDNTMLSRAYWKYYFAYCKINQYVLRNKGDDSIFKISKKDRLVCERNLQHFFVTKQDFVCHGLGQIVKYVRFGTIEEVTFLSNEFFIGNNGKLRMTRIPARVFQTLAWSIKVPANNVTDDVRRSLCFSKGHSLLAWSRGLPIFEVLARKLIELGKQGKYSEEGIADEPRHWGDVDDRTSYLAYLSTKYGLDVWMVEGIENTIKDIKNFDDVLEINGLHAFFYH
jgi:uncharacterized membrane protein